MELTTDFLDLDKKENYHDIEPSTWSPHFFIMKYKIMKNEDKMKITIIFQFYQILQYNILHYFF